MHSTYVNSGTMSDYLKFLMSNAEEQNKARGYYRCYCKILHEYHDFYWFDEGESPHIIDGCDAFVEYAQKVEGKEESLHELNKHLRDTNNTQPGYALKS